MATLLAITALAGVIALWFYQMYYKEEPPPMPTPDPLPEPIPEAPEPVQTEVGQLLYLKSKSLLGQELTPNDEIPDYVGCVANLQVVFFKATGRYIGQGAALYNTRALKNWMLKDTAFELVTEHLPGDIYVYATGEGNGKVSNGHCGIVGKKDWMNHDSKTGLWSANSSEEKSRAYFEVKGGYKRYVFRPL